MTTTEPTPTPETEPTPTDPAQDSTGGDPAAEVARLKDELTKARKWEDRAKANAAAAKELETLRQSSMNETEKAVAQARLEARTEALREVGTKLAEASIRVAAAGRNVDVDALIEGVDASKFLDEHGDPNTQAIAAWVDRVAPPVDDSDRPATRRDLGLGARGQAAPALNGDPLLRDLEKKLGLRG